MQYMWKCAFVGALLAATVPANASDDATYTIGGFRDYCADVIKTAKPAYHKLSFCLGVVRGFLNGFQAGNLAITGKLNPNVQLLPDGRTGNEFWCLPKDVDGKQVLAVFMQWSDRNPAQWHQYFTLGFMHSLSETWPWKK